MNNQNDEKVKYGLRKCTLCSFKTDGDDNRLYFKNYNGIDESVIFQNILKKLKEDEKFTVNKTVIKPLKEITECSMGDLKFDVIYDIDDGPFIFSESKEIIDELEKYFN